MPTYQYECKGCGSSWEETHKIAEREKPLKVPCRVCFDEIRLIPQIPSMISMRDGWQRHTSSGWKDRLKEIKRNNPGSTLDV
tara:strand:- start:167 stop:412 length:246 start_codon:yes stop_codon:yes gene_type:complete